jgi:hypothetical protein
MFTPEQLKEIELIGRNGRLDPEIILDFASNPKTALHSRFNWDDAKAAHQHRLLQARNLIRVYVKNIPVGDNLNRMTRVYVRSSTVEDEGSGYVLTTDTLSDEEQRRRLIVSVLKRMLAHYTSYPLPELDGVATKIRSTIFEYEEPLELEEAV